MRKILFGFLLLAAAPPAQAQERFRIDTVPAPSLRRNLLGDPDKRAVAIYLPPGYEAHPERRYPVVYLLHGFGGGIDPFLKRIRMDRVLDSLMNRGALKEMILVAPDASNALTGSFFRNSPVTGRWESFMVRDLIGYIDRNYRTMATRQKRGIAGWSMGGYGALLLAARHTDKFAAVYSLSACCLSADLPYDPQWKQRGTAALKVGSARISGNFNASIVTALGAIYTPASNRPPHFAQLPWEMNGDSVVVVDSIAANWRDTPLEIIRQSPTNVLRRLRISFDAGDRDAFPDIPVKAGELHQIFMRKSVPHDFEIFSGTHGDRLRERIETRLLPFFSRAFR